MLELIAKIVLLGSGVGIAAILYRKVPILVSLPKEENIVERPKMASQVAERVRNSSFLKTLSLDVFLQKFLSRIKIAIMRVENKISQWLMVLRERAQKKKVYANDNYWKDIKEQAGLAAEKLTHRKRRLKKEIIVAEAGFDGVKIPVDAKGKKQ